MTRAEWDCEQPRKAESSDDLDDGVEWFVHAAFRDAAPRANVAMAVNAAAECRRLGARRALLLSSGSIYGGRDGTALTEQSKIPSDPELDAYARSVKEAEDAFSSGAGAAELIVARLFFPSHSCLRWGENAICPVPEVPMLIFCALAPLALP